MPAWSKIAAAYWSYAVSIGHRSPRALAAATSRTVSRRVDVPPYSGWGWLGAAEPVAGAVPEDIAGAPISRPQAGSPYGCAQDDTALAAQPPGIPSADQVVAEEPFGAVPATDRSAKSGWGLRNETVAYRFGSG